MTKKKTSIGVFASKNRLTCMQCDHEEWMDIGEYPYSWQTTFCSKCESVMKVHEHDYKSFVVYKDGSTKWIRNYRR